jgi:Fur family transcriptional regulator, ferric uptake regulator
MEPPLYNRTVQGGHGRPATVGRKEPEISCVGDATEIPVSSTAMPQPIARNTRQKQAIRDAFIEANRPLSPEEALTAAQHHYATLGIATVYRNIKSLLAEGWLDSVSLPGQSTRYEVAGKAHHHHFHCRKCGRMYELGGCAGTVLPKPPRGFRVAGHELLLYGNCARCAETAPAKLRGRGR